MLNIQESIEKNIPVIPLNLKLVIKFAVCVVESFPQHLNILEKNRVVKNGLTGRCRKCLGDINKKIL